MRPALALLVGGALLALPLRAEWIVTDRLGGTVAAVAVRDSILFTGVGSRLLIHDVTDPAAPREIGSTPLFRDAVADIAISGSLAYVAAGTDGVHIVEVSDDAGPRLIGHWDSPGSAESIAVSDSTLYVADGPFGLQIVDVSDPAAPVPVGSAFDTNFVFDVAVRDGRAFLAGADAGLLVADVGAGAPRQIAVLDTPGFARDLTISGETLYLADQWGGVRIISIAQPSVPHEIAHVQLPGWAFAVTKDDATLYVACGLQGLRSIDVSEPLQPHEEGLHTAVSKLAWKVAVSNGLAFLAVRTEGVRILDVQTPGAFQQVGEVAPMLSALGVTTRGEFVYVVTMEQGLRVVELPEAGGLRERGGTEPLPGNPGCTEAVGDRFVYVGGSRLDVIDVSDADHPMAGAPVALINGARELLEVGTRVYMPDEYGLEVFDVADPGAPVLSGRLAFPVENEASLHATSVAVAGMHAFVSAGPEGVRVVDVSNPSQMQLVGSWIPEGGSVSEVEHRDGFLYAASGLPTPQLLVLDVADARHPVQVGAVSLPGFVANDLLLDGDYAFVANGGAGLAVIDIRDPAEPFIDAQVQVPGFAQGLALAGGRLLVTLGGGGLATVEQIAGATVHIEGGHRSEAASPPVSEPNRGPLRLPRRPDIESPRRVVNGRSVVVVNTADSGPGTLRAALEDLAPGDVITFDPAAFPPASPVTIRPSTPFPRLKVSGVTIDASNAGVILDGGALSGEFDSGIDIEDPSSDNVIRGLQIVNFPSCGIFIGGNGRNVIGGDRSRGSGPTGEGNVLSANRKGGILVTNPNGNRFVGNLIGTDASGRHVLGPQDRGINLFFQPGSGTEQGGDRIGGDEEWEANVIAGNAASEVVLHWGGGHTVAGNYIGTDEEENALGNAFFGIQIDGSSDNLVTGNVILARHAMQIIDPAGSCNQVIGNRFGVARDGSIIVRPPSGGTGVAVNQSFNRISGNVFGGIPYTGVGPSGISDYVVETIISGNTFLGMSPGQPIPGTAINVDAASRTFVGGSAAGSANHINAGATGIRLAGGANRTFILGNAIGDAASSLRNADGIHTGSADYSFIQNNTIAHNSGRGVVVGAATNRIRRNSIHDNGGAPIAIDAATAAVPLPPVIETVTLESVTGSACPLCTIEIYSDTGAEAGRYEGSVQAGEDGRFSFRYGFPLQGPNITATATNGEGSTSEVSSAVAAPPRPPRRRAVRH